MKNKEKYIDIILNTDSDICNELVKPVILKRFNRKCSECICVRCYMLQSIWLEEEYKESETSRRERRMKGYIEEFNGRKLDRSPYYETEFVNFEVKGGKE